MFHWEASWTPQISLDNFNKKLYTYLEKLERFFHTRVWRKFMSWNIHTEQWHWTEKFCFVTKRSWNGRAVMQSFFSLLVIQLVFARMTNPTARGAIFKMLLQIWFKTGTSHKSVGLLYVCKKTITFSALIGEWQILQMLAVKKPYLFFIIVILVSAIQLQNLEGWLRI